MGLFGSSKQMICDDTSLVGRITDMERNEGTLGAESARVCTYCSREHSRLRAMPESERAAACTFASLAIPVSIEERAVVFSIYTNG